MKGRHERTNGWSIADEIYKFDHFALNAKSLELLRDGEPVAIRPQPAHLLLHLVRNAGATLTRQELADELWPDHYVEIDQGLNSCVRQIRVALADDAEHARFLETLPRIGYRFVASVEKVGRSRSWLSRYRLPSVAIASGLVSAALLVLLVSNLNLLHNRTDANAAEVPNQAIPRLVVLPFLDQGSPDDDPSLALSITEELTNRLVNESLSAGAVEVIGLTSAMHFRSGREPIEEIRKRLDVNFVVEGSLRENSNQRLVQVRVVDAGTHSVVWTDSTELSGGTDSNNLARLARSLVFAVSPNGEPSEEPPQSKIDPEAHLSYLGARAELRTGEMESARRAQVLFERALELTPRDAPTVAGLARAYLIQREYDKARTTAEAAVELDPNLAEPHDVLANVVLMFDWNWDEAERHARRAIEVAPSAVSPHRTFSLLLSSSARHDEAIREIERALRLDPLSPDVRTDYGMALFWARRFGDALFRCRQALEIDPAHIAANYCAVNALIELDRTDDAVEYLPPLFGHLEAAPSPDATPEQLLKELWKAILDWKLSHGAEHSAAIPYLRLGRPEQALNCLATALNKRAWFLVLLRHDPRFDALRGNPEFERISATVTDST